MKKSKSRLSAYRDLEKRAISLGYEGNKNQKQTFYLNFIEKNKSPRQKLIDRAVELGFNGKRNKKNSVYENYIKNHEDKPETKEREEKVKEPTLITNWDEDLFPFDEIRDHRIYDGHLQYDVKFEDISLTPTYFRKIYKDPVKRKQLFNSQAWVYYEK